MTPHRLVTTTANRLLVAVTAIISVPAFTPMAESHLFSQSLSDRQMENLAAFTKLYGYIRFFHPSDEAARMDWDKFAVYGCTRMLTGSDHSELKVVLNEIFAPIAPSVIISESGNPTSTDAGNPLSADTSRLKMVAWQHRGVGLSPSSIYTSIRLNRRNVKARANPYGFGTLTGSLELPNIRGKPITLRAAVRVERGSRGQLWLRVDRPGAKMGFFDNMGDRPISSTDWKQYEIAGTVDSDAVRISFGCMMMGAGKVWLDDVHVLSGEPDQQEEIKLTDAGFEDDSLGALPHGWSVNGPEYEAKVTNETASAGAKSVSLKSTIVEQPSELFPERPIMGEFVASDLPGGISCRIPLVLLADSLGTLPHGNRKELDALDRKMEDSLPERLTGSQLSVRLADIVIAWNVFQHFYPYFDVAGVNWENELSVALNEASRDSSEIDFLRTLQRFVAQLHDGHGSASLLLDSSMSFLPPLLWTWTEVNLVITAVYDSLNAPRAVGDIVLEVNGVPARRAVEGEEIYMSGATPQWRRFRSLAGLLSGSRNSKLELITENGAGTKRTLILTRTLSRAQYFTLEQQHQHPTLKVADGVFYINLSISPMPAIDSLMPDLANARGVICDLRGYPNGNHELICHLLSAPDTSTHWMAVPKIIYPDRKKLAGYEYAGWHIQPKLPHIGGKVVFLTDGRAISYAESYLSFIEHYKLADIVGEPTAGTNGNVNVLTLPGGYRLTWTGMRVTKHDGSRHHGVGIQPTVRVHRTVKGIREGKDEQLDGALKLINKTSR